MALRIWIAGLLTFLGTSAAAAIVPDDLAEYQLVESTLREKKIFRPTPDFVRGGLAPHGPPDISLFTRQCDTTCTSCYLVSQGFSLQSRSSYRVSQYLVTVKTDGQNIPPKITDISDASTRSGFSRRSFYFPDAP